MSWHLFEVMYMSKLTLQSMFCKLKALDYFEGYVAHDCFVITPGAACTALSCESDWSCLGLLCTCLHSTNTALLHSLYIMPLLACTMEQGDYGVVGLAYVCIYAAWLSINTVTSN